MKRRELITLLGGAAAAWPLAARAQQSATVPVVGFLNSASAGPYRQMVDAFRRGLNETGFVEGRNVMIDYRWAEGQYDRLPGFATDLVRRNVAVIVATGGPPAALAAKAAAATTPIVFITATRPMPVHVIARVLARQSQPQGYDAREERNDLGADRMLAVSVSVPTLSAHRRRVC